MQVTVKAPAKLNLTLDSVGLREDGYHLLKTVMQTVDIADRLTVTAAPEGEITLQVGGADVGSLEKNTVTRAAKLFLAETGIRSGVFMSLEKCIPTQAGMGGGSADGGAALLALDRLFDTRLPMETLLDWGVRIGADVPFCMVGGTAFCQGVGEQITPLPALPACSIVLAQPAVGVSTAQAYARLDGQPLLDRPNHPAMLAALERGDLPAIGRQLANVFEPAIALPEVAAIRQQMAAYAPLGSRMTGSGSVVYALFDSPDAAEACCQFLKESWPVAMVCHPCGGPEFVG